MATEDKNTTVAADATESPARRVAQATVGSARVDRVQPSGGSNDDQHSAGRTTVAEGVVAKIAGIAAREVAGVYALGGGGARALGALRDAVNATDLTQGVKVEVGETQAAADITIVVDYPAPMQDVAENVRNAVAGAISRMVGLEVVEVNIDVNDVHLPSDDSDDDSESRVS
ncbi:Asp23/Gls24 family envelope stress response protein [Leucobacter albus]|uniref:Asp23/Gls24 family envelope stress response protein n=1 Tax=Leucobacter albus TaxID=272210 RepID=A0ABW3TRV5_9MICO